MKKITLGERILATIVFEAVILAFFIFGALLSFPAFKFLLDIWVGSVFFQACMTVVCYIFSPVVYSMLDFKERNDNPGSFFYKLKVAGFLFVMTIAPPNIILGGLPDSKVKSGLLLVFENLFFWVTIACIYYFLAAPRIIKILRKNGIDWFEK